MNFKYKIYLKLLLKIHFLQLSLARRNKCESNAYNEYLCIHMQAVIFYFNKKIIKKTK